MHPVLAQVKPRLVFGQFLLSEAVRAVELGLDAALLECAKMFTWRRNLGRLMALGPHELVFRGFADEVGPEGGLLLAVRRLGDSKILDELVMPPRVLEEVAEERATLEAQLPDLFARPYVSATRYLFGDAPPAAPAT